MKLDPRIQGALNHVRRANEGLMKLEHPKMTLSWEKFDKEISACRVDLSVASGTLAAIIDELPVNSPLLRPRGASAKERQ